MTAIPMADESKLGELFDMDEKLEQDGVSIQYGPLAVRIARMGGSNKQFSVVFEKLSRPYRRMVEGGVEMPEQIAEEILHNTYAQTIVKDWNLSRKDPDTGESVAVPCTPDEVKAQFVKRPEFLKFVVQEAQRAANYRLRAVEDDSKN